MKPALGNAGEGHEGVAPRRGAWIETSGSLRVLVGVGCRAPQGRVD